MASASALLSLPTTLNHHLSPSKLLCQPTLTSLSTPPVSSQRRPRGSGRIVAAVGGDLLGDLGARDPFPAEIESNFDENVVGNAGTEHKILIPNLSALSLAQRSCEPVSPSQSPMSGEDAEKLLKKVVGWRLVEVDGGRRLQCLWKVRDYGCGVELISRIYTVAHAAGHYPNLHLEQPNQVTAELWTSLIGHYVVICGYDADTKEFEIRDPASARKYERVSLECRDEACKSIGTDEDILLVQWKVQII